LQSIEMERTAACVDVAAIGRDAHRNDFRSKRVEEFGAEFISGTVGAIEEEAETGELGSVNDATAEKIEIFGVERRVGDEERRIVRRRIGAMLEDVRFERFFDGVRELHASVGEQFYTVVVIGIVGGGDDDAGLKIILADEASYAGGCDDTCKGYGRAGLRKTGCQKSGNMGARFAGVHADKDAGGGMFAKQISG